MDAERILQTIGVFDYQTVSQTGPFKKMSSGSRYTSPRYRNGLLPEWNTLFWRVFAQIRRQTHPVSQFDLTSTLPGDKVDGGNGVRPRWPDGGATARDQFLPYFVDYMLQTLVIIKKYIGLLVWTETVDYAYFSIALSICSDFYVQKMLRKLPILINFTINIHLLMGENMKGKEEGEDAN